jgi:shikimate kinase
LWKGGFTLIRNIHPDTAKSDIHTRPNIVLIGMPGVGKSTVGVLLAKRMRMAFMDTDIVIQTRTGRTLQQIIEAEGVIRFREQEARHILDLNVSGHVIATGGSVVYSSRAMSHLNSQGIVVFLELGLDDLKNRLGDLDARGVVRMPGQEIEDIFTERMPLYQKFARITIACQGLTPDQVKENVVAQVESL